VTRHGGPDVLQVVEEALPEPRTAEARVKVLAAGVSAYDLMFRRSRSLPGTPRVPFSLGEDVVGVVDKLGERVSTVEPGQTVAGATFCLGVGGGYAEHVCLPASELVPVPTEGFVERIYRLTGDGVDAVFDPIGGARQLWRSYRALRKGGRLVWFGVAATKKEGLRVIPLTLLMRTLLALIPDGKRVPLTPDLGKDNFVNPKEVAHGGPAPEGSVGSGPRPAGGAEGAEWTKSTCA
jgi:NADPH:quinone reductase-like Zn-dependent oxidoreductase